MDVFSAIAQPTRRSILEMLATRGQLSATDISDRFRVSPPAISQHLKILRDARLVRMQKRAQKRMYEINPQAVGEVEDWARHMTALWNDRFDRLESLLRQQEQEAPASKTKGRKDRQHGRRKGR
jgi:DNA-binding transcriptional ArsR family regulator